MMEKWLRKIPLKRQVFYLVILALMPLFIVGYNFSSKRNALLEQEREVERLTYLAYVHKKRQAVNEAVRAHYLQASPTYLQERVETLPLLETERKALETIMESRMYTGNEAVHRRHSTLTNGNNALRFKEKRSDSAGGIQESVESLIHSVELDTIDLKELLARLEKEEAGKPQLLITDFSLERCVKPNKNEVYELNLELIKREYHHA